MRSKEFMDHRGAVSRGSLSLWLALAFAASILFFFEVRGIQFYLVPSDSMKPTLMRSDYIGGFEIEPSQLQHGDIVVFTSGYEGDFYVKRVVGLPGDTLRISQGFVYINGSKLDEPYVTHRGKENIKPLEIPKNRIFIMGDNRTNSTDSRRFGPIPARQVEAKVSFIYSPVARMGTVG